MSPTEHRDAPDPSRRKSILVCQFCGHESAVDGDWTTQTSADGVALSCPDCEHDVLHRRCA